MKGAPICLFNVNEATLSRWHKLTTRRDEVCMLLQGRVLPQLDVSAEPTPAAETSRPTPSVSASVQITEAQNRTGTWIYYFPACSTHCRVVLWKRKLKEAHQLTLFTCAGLACVRRSGNPESLSPTPKDAEEQVKTGTETYLYSSFIIIIFIIIAVSTSTVCCIFVGTLRESHRVVLHASKIWQQKIKSSTTLKENFPDNNDHWTELYVHASPLIILQRYLGPLNGGWQGRERRIALEVLIAAGSAICPSLHRGIANFRASAIAPHSLQELKAKNNGLLKCVSKCRKKRRK